MKRPSKFCCIFSFLLVLALAAVPARAGWYFSYGTAAVIQDMTSVATRVVYGWGSYIKVKKGESVWVHVPFTNPAMNDITVSEVQLHWKADAKSIYIAQVDVYDAPIRFWTKTGRWQAGTSGTKITTWKLGRDWKIYRGFGASLLVKNSGGADQSVTILCFGAHFSDL